MSGELAKIVIRGYELPDESSQQGDPIAEFKAMFNPESFGVNTTFEQDESQADSDTGSEYKFKNIAPREFNFDFIIDATGASGSSKDIEEEVDKFKNATGFKELAGFTGKSRRTFFLSISWGNFSIRCILKSMEVKYTLFRPDGSPIRATISAVFGEYKTHQQQARENPESVLGLTQVRNVLDKDNLTGMAKELYGDGKRYIDLAKANNLDNLKELASGSRLNFPPVDQLADTLKDQAAPFVDRAQEIVQGAKKLAEGKDQVLQTVNQLAESATQQAQAAIAQAESTARQLQSQVEAQVQGQVNSLLRQGQSLAGQVQTQAGQFVQEATQFAQGTAQGLLGNANSLVQQGTQFGQGLLQNATGFAQQGSQFVQGAGQGLIQNASGLIQQGSQFAQGTGQGLLQNANQLLQGGSQDLLQSGRDFLDDGISNITQFFDF